MMLTRLLAAFEYARQKTKKLCVCVIRVVHMLMGLSLSQSLFQTCMLPAATYPLAFSEHQPSETMCRSSSEAWWASYELLVHHCHFEEVLGQRPRLQIVVIRFADSAKETHWPWPTKLKLKHGKHESLGLQDLINSVTSIYHVDDLLHRRTIDLLILGRDEDGRCPYQL